MYIIAKRPANQINATTVIQSTSPKVHPNILEAAAEAERLAKQNVGWEFIVFKAQSSVSVKPVFETNVTRFD